MSSIKRGCGKVGSEHWSFVVGQLGQLGQLSQLSHCPKDWRKGELKRGVKRGVKPEWLNYIALLLQDARMGSEGFLIVTKVHVVSVFNQLFVRITLS